MIKLNYKKKKGKENVFSSTQLLKLNNQFLIKLSNQKLSSPYNYYTNLTKLHRNLPNLFSLIESLPEKGKN